MKTFRLFVTPRAERDIAKAYEWYHATDPRVAERFRAEIFDIFDRISTSALTYAANEAGVRKRHLRRFRYTVYFRESEGAVAIVTVAHQRRQPPDWRHGA